MPPGAKKPSLLIVDDDEHLRYIFSSAAERCGEFGAIWQAADGSAALAMLHRMLKAEDPDGGGIFVLTDLSMPGMDGLEFVRAAKSDAATRDVPIVMITSSNIPNAKEDALNAGCCAFFAKPERFDLIMKLIASLPSAYRNRPDVSSQARGSQDSGLR
jgi:CheY-like chemotaxis protein